MKTAPQLPDRVQSFLRSGAPAVLLTVGEDGWGHAAMTWAAAVGPDRVRFVVDHGSATLANLERGGKASLQVIGPDNVLALIKGHARSQYPRVEAAPFGMAMWEMTVTEVRDQTWGPVAVSPLVYRWVGPEAEALSRIEQAVLAELRERA
jgi:flavin reductase (DIM6/NTAB) family NADH-FMN oxidoreductase RutF